MYFLWLSPFWLKNKLWLGSFPSDLFVWFHIKIKVRRKWICCMCQIASVRLYHQLDLQTLEEPELHQQEEQSPDQSARQCGRPVLCFHPHHRSVCFHRCGENGRFWKTTKQKLFKRGELRPSHLWIIFGGDISKVAHAKSNDKEENFYILVCRWVETKAFHDSNRWTTQLSNMQIIEGWLGWNHCWRLHRQTVIF